MPAPTIRKQVEELREIVELNVQQTGQIRRAFGFNGKLNDAEAEAVVRDTFGEMRLLAQERRADIKKHQAWEIVYKDLAQRFAFLSPFHSKLTWAVGAITASVMWQMGPIVFKAVLAILHANRLLGQ